MAEKMAKNLRRCQEYGMTAKARKRCSRLGGRAGYPANSRDCFQFLIMWRRSQGRENGQKVAPLDPKAALTYHNHCPGCLVRIISFLLNLRTGVKTNYLQYLHPMILNAVGSWTFRPHL